MVGLALISNRLDFQQQSPAEQVNNITCFGIFLLAICLC